MMRDKRQRSRSEAAPAQAGEQGYMLVGLIVAIAIILLMLSVAAADIAHTVRVERERESARRAQQYVRAIRLFYKKNNSYPASVKALENTNMIRYLRQKYTDPLTGKEYRLIGVGQNKTTVKGFFGQPLGGIAGGGLGSLAGAASGGMPGAPGAAGPGGATATNGVGANGTNGTNGTASGPGSSSGTSGFGSNPFSTGPMGTMATSGSTGPFMGVGSSAKGDSILIVNEQTTYDTWEFLYDPRIEKLYAAAALGAGLNSGTPGSLGQGSGNNNSGFGNNNSGFGSTNSGGTNGPTGGTNSTGSNGSATPNGGTPPTGP
jgi:type II secretory pathway pseudopilin PulG